MALTRHLPILVLLASCAGPSVGTTHVTKTPTPSSTAEEAHAAARHKVLPTWPERSPPAAVTTPRQGDPSPDALKAARLQQSSCEQATAEDVETRIKEMRAAVDASFKEWHDEQPACWEADRERYRLRKEAEAAAARGWGLGLSGVGEGGGGYGEGIGLGSIGTIGHGASGGVAMRAAPSPPMRARSASGTNNQVASVDEADIVKTDGRYVYFAANGALRIVEAMNPRLVSVTKLPGNARELFVEGDRAVVYTSTGSAAPRCTYAYDCTFGGDGSSTKVTVLDVANRAEPRITRQIELSGSLIAARRTFASSV